MIDVLINKVSNDREYLAWYFRRYMATEKKSIPDLLNQLEINQEQFNKASLCKAPSGTSTDFTIRIKQIADYIGMNVFPLAQIIRSVDNSVAFNDVDAINASLLAAREKGRNDNTSDHEKKDG